MGDKLKIYLDSNVLSYLRNRDSNTPDGNSIYHELFTLLDEHRDDFVIPYSTAHIHDLKASYRKDIARTDESLEFLGRLTNNMCVALYWGSENAIWHERAPKEFMESAIQEDTTDFLSLEKLEAMVSEHNVANPFEPLKEIPHGLDFKRMKDGNEFFASLFPTAETEGTKYAMLKDTFDLMKKMRTDPAIYKGLADLFKRHVRLDPNLSNIANVVEGLDQMLPKTMIKKTFTELGADESTDQIKNGWYNKITDVYMKLDFVGFNSDKLDDKNKYDNVFNDALHCFYASHCHIFLTADRKSYRKSKAVYESLKIGTRVLTPEEMIKEINE